MEDISLGASIVLLITPRLRAVRSRESPYQLPVKEHTPTALRHHVGDRVNWRDHEGYEEKRKKSDVVQEIHETAD